MVSTNDENEPVNNSNSSTRRNCYSNFIANWRLSMFSLRNSNGQILNISKTFQHEPKLLWSSIKLGVIAWCIHIIYVTADETGWAPLWFSQLTHWQLIMILGYCLGSFVLQVIPLIQQNELMCIGKTRILVNIIWSLYILAITFGFMVTVLFWILLYEPGWDITYDVIMPHGIVFLFVILDGMVLNRIPIRLKQFVVMESMVIAYLLWTVIQGFSFEWQIYSIIDWRDNPSRTAVLVLGVAFIFAPISFLLIWLVTELLVKSRYDNEREAEINNGDVEEGDVEVANLHEEEEGAKE